MSKLVCLATNLITEVKYALTHVSYAVVTVNGQKLTDKATLSPSNARTTLKLSLLKSNIIKLQVGGLPTASVRTVVRENAALQAPPIAVAAADTLSGIIPQSITFNAIGSYDSDGTITRAVWAFADQSKQEGFVVSKLFGVSGKQLVSLVVYDNSGLASEPTTLEVNLVENQLPTAIITITAAGSRKQKILDASKSSDPENQSLRYEWLVDSTPYNGKAVEVTLADGVHQVDLKVTDSKYGSATVRTHVEILPNALPVSTFVATNIGNKFEFDASGSKDVDGSITRYIWTFNSVDSSEGSKVSRTFEPGTEVLAKLDVFDNEGGVASSQQQLIIPSVPTIVAQVSFSDEEIELLESSNETILLPEITSLIRVSAEIRGFDGAPAESFKIDFGDGTTITGPSGSHRYSTPGTYTVRISSSVSAVASQTITANFTNADDSACLIEGFTHCLFVTGLTDGTVRNSDTHFTIRSPDGTRFSPQAAFRPLNVWIHSTPNDAIDITSAAEVLNGELRINVQKLGLLVPFKPGEFSLDVNVSSEGKGPDDVAENIHGFVRGLRLGSANLALTSQTFSGVVSVRGLASGVQKDASLLTGSTLLNLPLDTYLIEGESFGGYISGYAELTSGALTAVLNPKSALNEIKSNSVVVSSGTSARLSTVQQENTLLRNGKTAVDQVTISATAVPPTAWEQYAEDNPLTWFAKPGFPRTGYDRRVDSQGYSTITAQANGVLWKALAPVMPLPGSQLQVQCSMIDSNWLKESKLVQETRAASRALYLGVAAAREASTAAYIASEAAARRASGCECPSLHAQANRARQIYQAANLEYGRLYDEHIFGAGFGIDPKVELLVLEGMASNSHPLDMEVVIEIKNKSGAGIIRKTFPMKSAHSRGKFNESVEAMSDPWYGYVSVYTKFASKHLQTTYAVDIPTNWNQYESHVEIRALSSVGTGTARREVPDTFTFQADQFASGRCRLVPSPLLRVTNIVASKQSGNSAYSKIQYSNAVSFMSNELMPTTFDLTSSGKPHPWTTITTNVKPLYDLKLDTTISLSSADLVPEKMEIYLLPLSVETESAEYLATEINLLNSPSKLLTKLSKRYSVSVNFDDIERSLRTRATLAPDEQFTLRVVPIGRARGVLYRGQALDLFRTPLYDLRRLNPAYYGNTVSAFARRPLVDFVAAAMPLINSQTGKFGPFAINDGALPYGGKFAPHSSHQLGRSLDIEVPVNLSAEGLGGWTSSLPDDTGFESRMV
ncbi:MAG: hypothetical protein EOP06_02050 [Proteobacteria bacterium]|nr:MAG: hypothetical protein EOP06_02050 [Pseudomonadota bacterium]